MSGVFEAERRRLLQPGGDGSDGAQLASSVLSPVGDLYTQHMNLNC